MKHSYQNCKSFVSISLLESLSCAEVHVSSYRSSCFYTNIRSRKLHYFSSSNKIVKLIIVLLTISICYTCYVVYSLKNFVFYIVKRLKHYIMIIFYVLKIEYFLHTILLLNKLFSVIQS